MDKRSRKCKDHLEKQYDSIKDMCKAYAIPYTVFSARRRRGISLKDALTQPPNPRYKGRRTSCEGADGTKYNSLLEMAELNDMPPRVVYARKALGWGKEDMLKPVGAGKGNAEACEDHLGNKYNSKTEMAAAYGMSRATLGARMKRNPDNLEAVLTTPKGGGTSAAMVGKNLESASESAE